MKVPADGFAARVIATARPARPWLHITVSPRVARFLVPAGARPGPTLLPDPDLDRPDFPRRSYYLEMAARKLEPDPDVDRSDFPRLSPDVQEEDKVRGLPNILPHRWDPPHIDDMQPPDLPPGPLRGADLQGHDLSGHDLHNRDLTGAKLMRANLVRADLSGANLKGADLSDANLVGANLVGAILVGATLIGVRWSDETRWPGGFAEAMADRSIKLRSGAWLVAGSGRSAPR